MLAQVHEDGRVVLNGLVFRASLGRAGLVAFKLEGDGGTPRGYLPLRRVLYRADRLPPPRAAVPLEPLAQNDGWCDAPSSRFYNRRVTLPFDASHEELWRRDEVYDIIGILGWNDDPVERDRGSAIFLHIAEPNYPPTSGCVALARRDLLALLAAGLTGLQIG